MTSKKKDRPALAILLAGITMVYGCASLKPPGSSSSGGANWEVSLTRLKVTDAQEESSVVGFPMSDGDEPYLIVFGFKSRFGTPNSTTVYTNQYDNYSWAGHLRTGEQTEIPPGVGSMRFIGLSYEDVVGVIVVAMESDRTFKGVIEKRVQESAGNLRNSISAAVTRQNINRLDAARFIDDLHETMQNAVSSLSAAQTFEDRFYATGDTDDHVGVSTLLFFNSSPSRTMRFPYFRTSNLTDVFTDRDFLFHADPVSFQNGRLGAHYEAEVRVRSF